MQSINLPPTVAPATIPDSALGNPQEVPTVLEDPGREKSLFLTSLLLTSSLVTFVLTTVPQLFSLPGLPAILQQSTSVKPALAEHWLAQPARLNLTVPPTASAGIPAESGKPTIVVQSATSPVTLSLPATSEPYVVYVLVQPQPLGAVSTLASQPK
jgi:hypothetical protein